MRMQPLFSVQSIKAIEAAFVQQQGIELYELMLRAGARAFERARSLWPDASHWLIATGAGNNAGDGLVVAKHALNAGYNVTLVALKPYDEFQGDPQKAWQELWQQVQSLDLPEHQTFNILDLASAQEENFSTVEVAVDALLGTGVSGELRDEYQQIIERLNTLDCFKLALDIPTGIYADSGCVTTRKDSDGNYINTAFQADATVSFVALKAGQCMNHALPYQGQLILETLGVRSALSFGEEPQAWHIELNQLKRKLPEREAVGSKFDCGHVLIVGGGKDLGGAAILSAIGAIRTGAGMVSCWLDASHQGAALSLCPEIMWRGLSSLADDLESLKAQLGRFEVVALGPGLGRDKVAEQCFLSVVTMLREAQIPLILDADGLYWLAQRAIELPPSTIITPHIGEATHLMNAQQEDVLSSGRIEPQLSVDTAYVEQNRISVAETLAVKYGATCVLKGAATVVSDGQQSFITAGAHPAMMTAGLGDVLTGLIASLVAQGSQPLDAALLATSLHYEAGVSAAGERTRGMLASEVIEELNRWINRLK